jgi:hypothetical protein
MFIAVAQHRTSLPQRIGGLTAFLAERLCLSVECLKTFAARREGRASKSYKGAGKPEVFRKVSGKAAPMLVTKKP